MISEHYDTGLAIFAIAAALAAALLALACVRKATTQPGVARRYWLVSGALLFGFGLWSAQFIALFAYRMPVPVSYALAPILIALAIAMVYSGIAFYIVSRPGMGLRQWLVGGLSMGAVLTGMHYTGMLALRMQASVQYDAILFPLSLVLALAVALGTLLALFRFRERLAGRLLTAQLRYASGIGLGLCAMHVAVIAAMIVTPGGSGPIDVSLYAVDQQLLLLLMLGLLLALLLLLPVLIRILRAEAVEGVFVDRFNLWLVGVALTTIVLLLSAQWFIARAFSLEAVLVQVGYRAQARAAEVHLWFEHLLEGSEAIDVDKDIDRQLADASTVIDIALHGGVLEGGRVEAVTDRHLRTELLALHALLARWGEIIESRVRGGERWGKGSVQEREFDQIFVAIQGLASDVTQDAAELEQRNRDTFVLVNGATVVLFAMVFASVLLITRRRRQELEGKNRDLRHTLQELERQQYALDQHAIVAITDAQGRLSYVNDALCAASQYSRAELLGQDQRLLCDVDDPEAFFEQLWGTVGAGEVWRGEIRNRRKDGTPYWASMTVVPFCDAHGQPYQYLMIRSDITPLKQTEEALRAQQQWLQTLIEAVPDAISLKDGDGRWLIANRLQRRLYLLDDIDYQGKTSAELAALSEFHRKVMMSAQFDDEQVWRAREAQRSEEIVAQPNAGPRTIEVNKVPLFDADGNRKGLVTAGRDITVRKRLEAEVILMATVIEQMKEAVFIADTEGRIEYVNPTYEQASGYSREELLGGYPPLLAPARGAAREAILQALLRGGDWTGTFASRRKDGGTYTEELMLTPIYSADGRVVNVVGVGREIG